MVRGSRRHLAAVLSLLLHSPTGFTGPAITVEALFKDRALLRIDGRTQLMRVGDTSEEGVTLLEASAMGATVRLDDREIDLTLHETISTRVAPPPEVAEVSIWRDEQGFFRVPGTLNGVLADFLVDTGASHVALNERDARRFGIDYRAAGEPTRVNTAGGVTEAYAVTLRSLTIGDISRRDVPGLVILGNHPTHVLLGNSFLGSLDIENRGQQMILRKKY